MARSVKKRPVVGKIGNYAAPVDTAGMDEDMIGMMIGTKPTKVESDYMKSRPNSMEAVKRARRANRQPPLKP
jgi:hypothetical protein